MGKKNRSRAPQITEEEIPEEKDTSHLPPLVRLSDETPAKKFEWDHKERLLLFCSRGVGARERHLMEDLRAMMPHCKNEPKFDTKDDLKAINEVCEMRNCNLVMYFEARSFVNLFMWVSDIIQGPSVKFQVLNVHTMMELNLTGNCLKGSRPLLKFSPSFDKLPHLILIKALFERIYGTPMYHPKSQPFFDHVFTFTYESDKIWFRNYQILEEDGEMAEIGPRFVLNPIKILDGSFSGATLWENPEYKTPSSRRQYLKMLNEDKMLSKDKQKGRYKQNKDLNPYKTETEYEALYEHDD